MQQFFALINNVMQESPDTQKRKLRIVTYKVDCPHPLAVAVDAHILLVRYLCDVFGTMW